MDNEIIKTAKRIARKFSEGTPDPSLIIGLVSNIYIKGYENGFEEKASTYVVALQEAYDTGYSDGYSEGYSEGYDEERYERGLL